MGKEYTRTLNNTSYVDKKLSKKSSKKSSKKNSKKNSKNSSKNSSNKKYGNKNISEKMLKILNSDTEVIYDQNNNNLQNNSIPYNGNIPQQYTNMNQQQQMNNIGAYSPSNYDSIMLQQMAPLETKFDNQEMFTNLNSLNKGPNISGNIPQIQENNVNFQNLNMLGTQNL